MPEHTIPESLIEQIRTGKAALVVGAGIGVPSWKQLLERLTKALETRGREGDDAATKDLEKLLHKGSLVRAVGVEYLLSPHLSAIAEAGVEHVFNPEMNVIATMFVPSVGVAGRL